MYDRRMFERISLSLQIKFWDVKANMIGEAEVKDISAKGIGFTTSEDLSAGTSIKIWLEIKDNGEHLYTEGTVMWSRQLVEGGYRIGVELVHPELMGFSRVLRLNQTFA